MNADRSIGQFWLELPPPTFKPGRPELLSEGSYLKSPEGFPANYDITADGQRFLMIKQGGQTEEAQPQIIVVQNWFEELERLVPTDK